MTTLVLAYADLQLAVRGYLGADWAAASVDDVLEAGYRWFLSGEYADPRRRNVLLYWQWSFLYPWATLTIWPTTQTAAVTVGGTGNKTLAVAADTFYPSMVGHKIVADTSGTEYTIDAYTNAKNVTVTADASADTGDTFTITADGIYQLPAAFGDLLDPFTYAEGAGLGPIQRFSEALIRQAKAGATVTGDPYWFALLPRAAYSGYVLETSGTFWDVVMYPTPSSVRVLTYRYKVLVHALDGAVYDYPLGGQEFVQAVLQCCLAKAEQMKRYLTGPQTALAQSDMLAAVRRDALKRGAKHLGKSVDLSDRQVERRWSTASDVTHPY